MKIKTPVMSVVEAFNDHAGKMLRENVHHGEEGTNHLLWRHS